MSTKNELGTASVGRSLYLPGGGGKKPGAQKKTDGSTKGKKKKPRGQKMYLGIRQGKTSGGHKGDLKEGKIPSWHPVGRNLRNGVFP